MNLELLSVLVAVGLLAGVLAMLELGWRLAARRRDRQQESASSGVGIVNGAVFGLLGLLIAFTFSGAATRFEGRRGLILEEANAVGTAWLRVDLLPAEAQAPIRDLFRKYLDSRLLTYRLASDPPAAFLEADRSIAIQGEVWAHAIASSRLPQASAQVQMLLLPALNAMFDIAATRIASTQMHPPVIIYLMLAGLVLSGALLVGHGMGGAMQRNWLHMATFAGCMTLAIYVIVDLELPRLGLFRVDAADQLLIKLRESMK